MEFLEINKNFKNFQTKRSSSYESEKINLSLTNKSVKFNSNKDVIFNMLKNNEIIPKRKKSQNGSKKATFNINRLEKNRTLKSNFKSTASKNYFSFISKCNNDNINNVNDEKCDKCKATLPTERFKENLIECQQCFDLHCMICNKNVDRRYNHFWDISKTCFLMQKSKKIDKNYPLHFRYFSILIFIILIIYPIFFVLSNIFLFFYVKFIYLDKITDKIYSKINIKSKKFLKIVPTYILGYLTICLYPFFILINVLMLFLLLLSPLVYISIITYKKILK